MPKEKKFYQYHEPVDFRDTWRIFKIMSEFVEGYQFISQFRKEVTFFGSARIKTTNKYYKLAEESAYLLGKKKHTIITGGGPGIMEAANKGAYDANAVSVGLNIQLQREQVINPYVKKAQGFHYFFTRKVMLTSPSQAFLYYPGGFGTLDEFFEVLDTMELGKMPKVPIGLVGKEFWSPLVEFLKKYSRDYIGSITEENLKLFTQVDTAQETVKLVEKTKERAFFKELSPTDLSTGESANWMIFRIMAELVEGFDFVSNIHDDITILGTRSVKPDSIYYQAAYDLAYKLGKYKYSIMTGGGAGIMEAANKGAYEAGASSIGVGIKTYHNSKMNNYLTKSLNFKFPFTRKLIITAPSLGFVAFPGGFGTMHQVFEILTLMQTGKIGKVPIILFDSKYWGRLDNFIKEILAKKFKTINPNDAKLYHIVDTIDEAIKIIKKVPRSIKKPKK